MDRHLGQLIERRRAAKVDLSASARRRGTRSTISASSRRRAGAQTLPAAQHHGRQERGGWILRGRRSGEAPRRAQDGAAVRRGAALLSGALGNHGAQARLHRDRAGGRRTTRSSANCLEVDLFTAVAGAAEFRRWVDVWSSAYASPGCSASTSIERRKSFARAGAADARRPDRASRRPSRIGDKARRVHDRLDTELTEILEVAMPSPTLTHARRPSTSPRTSGSRSRTEPASPPASGCPRTPARPRSGGARIPALPQARRHRAARRADACLFRRPRLCRRPRRHARLGRVGRADGRRIPAAGAGRCAARSSPGSPRSPGATAGSA